MINKNILSKKSIYQNNIEDNPSLRTFRFRKIKLASLNKTILIPKEKSILSTSICNNTNLSIGNILPKKFEIKINKFYELENLNTLNKIHKKGEQIRLNLKNFSLLHLIAIYLIELSKKVINKLIICIIIKRNKEDLIHSIFEFG